MLNIYFFKAVVTISTTCFSIKRLQV